MVTMYSFLSCFGGTSLQSRPWSDRDAELFVLQGGCALASRGGDGTNKITFEDTANFKDNVCLVSLHLVL